MAKNSLYKLYSAVFIAACAAPAVLTPLLKQDSSAEKRRLSEMPSVISDDGGLNTAFFGEFDTWFSEHFAFRQQLVNADNRLKTALLRTSPDPDVVCGSDGWLYYGDTVDDFLNIRQLSKRSISNIAHDLRLVNDYCSANGMKFIFTCVPNKNSMYPEHMPLNYVPSDGPDNYSMLSGALADSGFYCDMSSVLNSAASSIPLYHKTDTHWNNLGAFVAYNGLMTAAGKDPLPVGFDWSSAHDHRGDLAEMLYPAEAPKEQQVYSAYDFTYSYTSNFHALDDVIIDTACDGRNGSLLMFRDSFGEAILKYMAESYGNAEFSRAVPYKLSGRSDNPPDTVIIEIVERNLPNLQKNAPVMEAPAAVMPDNVTVSAEKLSHCTEAIAGLTHVFGVLPESFFSGQESRILVSCGQNCREAFNICECDLLGLDDASPYGFSLYVPDTEDVRELTITVMNNDGHCVSSVSTER